MDLRVTKAWGSGHTGEDINVLILDDGLDWKHPDLIDNYVSGHQEIHSNLQHSFPN